jgi:triphosphatase
MTEPLIESPTDVPAPAAPPREVELKYDIPDPAAFSLAELVEVLGPAWQLGPQRRVRMVDAYCDTAAFDLLRAGFAFRVRGAPAGVKVTLKSLERPGFDEALVSRLELEGLVADSARPLDAAGWPDAIRAEVAAAAGHAHLAPFVVVRQVRGLHPLRRAPTANETAARPNGPDSAPLAELSVDEVAVYAPTPGDTDLAMAGVARLLDEGTPALRFHELEVELAPDEGPAVLKAVQSRLKSWKALRPARASKLERAMLGLAEHPQGADAGVVGVTPTMSMAEAGRLMWRSQLTAVILNEAGARRGQDIEYVHDMRVATRRARAVARLFGAYFKPKALAGFLGDLRRTARTLGAVRDLDVALQKLQKYARTRPEGEQQGLLEMAAEWRIARREAYRELLAWLDSPPYRRFVSAFAAFSAKSGQGARDVGVALGEPPMPFEVRHVMPSAILNRFEQVRAYEPQFDGAEAIPVETLHALRIDCKALRYSLEPVQPLLGAEGTALVDQLKRLQDHLGDLNDAVVTAARLAEMRAYAPEQPALDTYHAVQEAIIADLSASAPDAWRAFVAPENRRLLALAIARL